MAKNNFKKKKTLKRSLRRNHTKKVASASLGSRTLNIRKKNRRSQKQRTTLRNKRNARVKIGGVDPVVGNVKLGDAWAALLAAKNERLARETSTPIPVPVLTAQTERKAGDTMTTDDLSIVSGAEEEKARRWEANKKEYNKTIPLELRQRNNYVAIQHKLMHICKEMHNVEDDNQEHLLFDAAEKLIDSKIIDSKNLSLSDKDIEAAKQEVLSAQNEGARRHDRSPRKDWFFTYDQRFFKVERTPAYIDTEYQYKYPPAIEYKTRMLEEEIINNPRRLQWPSEYNRYEMYDMEDDF
jgi:hypothetical protein